MAPKDKAIELRDKFLPLAHDWESDNRLIAKKCALICVDEMIQILPSVYLTKDEEIHSGHRQYWNEVKLEINKL